MTAAEPLPSILALPAQQGLPPRGPGLGSGLGGMARPVARALGKKAGAAYIPLPGQAAAHTVKRLPPNACKRHI